MNPLKILVVDDHEVVRMGLRLLFKQYPQFKIVGESDDATKAIEMVGETQADVVVMDIRLKGMNGIEGCREICSRYPNVGVLVLTSYGDEETVQESIMAGVKGYVLKQVGNDQLIRAIEAVGRGESALDPIITKKLLEKIRQPIVVSHNNPSVLTKQEKKVLALLGEGKTNREISKVVLLSEKTVRNYVSSIFSKLNLKNRSEAAIYATRYRTGGGLRDLLD